MRSRRKPRPAAGAGIARLVLRATIGATMIAHGVRHGRTLDGTARWFESLGFRRPRWQARLSCGVEVGAGAATVLGLATPVSTSAVAGTMAVAYRTVHRPNGYFVVNDGWEYVAFVSAASVALSALGPGPLSADRLLGIDGRPSSAAARAALTAGLGAAGAAGQLALFWRPPAVGGAVSPR